MRIAEPSTLVTDWLLALFTAWLAWELFRQAYRLKDRAIGLWLGAFCAVAVSAALGGAWHAFSAQMDQSLAAPLWSGTVIFASAGSLLFLLSTLHIYASGRLLSILAGVAVSKFALIALWLGVNEDFRIVVYDSALTMLVIVALNTWGAWARHLPSAPWILAGMLVSLLAALFQQGRVSLHPHFNHNDLYHVIQMGAMYLLCRGGLLLQEREPAAPDFEATQPPPPLAGEE